MAEITIGRTLSAATDSVTVEQGSNSVPWVASTPLAPENYDRVVLGYSGDDVTAVTYYQGATVVTVLTLAYSGGNLVSVSRA